MDVAGGRLQLHRVTEVRELHRRLGGDVLHHQVLRLTRERVEEEEREEEEREEEEEGEREEEEEGGGGWRRVEEEGGVEGN